MNEFSIENKLKDFKHKANELELDIHSFNEYNHIDILNIHKIFDPLYQRKKILGTEVLDIYMSLVDGENYPLHKFSNLVLYPSQNSSLKQKYEDVYYSFNKKRFTNIARLKDFFDELQAKLNEFNKLEYSIIDKEDREFEITKNPGGYLSTVKVGRNVYTIADRLVGIVRIYPTMLSADRNQQIIGSKQRWSSLQEMLLFKDESVVKSPLLVLPTKENMELIQRNKERYGTNEQGLPRYALLPTG
ncbi:MAG: hypothetical protein ACMXX6_01505 [Candidatus Woesearchaeota archaeon]